MDRPLWKRALVGMDLHRKQDSRQRTPEDEAEIARRVEIYRVRAERREPLFPFRRKRPS